MMKDNNPECRICKADASHQKIRANNVYGGRLEHKFWQCGVCDLVYLSPVPSEKQEHEFYAKEFEKFMEKRSGNDRNWSGPEKHIATNQDHVKRRLLILEDYRRDGMEILEIGCSSGFMLDAFKEEWGAESIGIEPSGGFENFLEERGHEVYRTTEELMSNRPNTRFDLIVHFFVLEHIRDTKSFLKQQIDILKPGGVIVAEVPNVNDPLTSLYNIQAFEDFYWSIAHHYYFSPKTISQILNELNCEFEFVLDQRYDLSNHITWLQNGVPGGQGAFNHIFSNETLESYKSDLIRSDKCDTFFLIIKKPEN